MKIHYLLMLSVMLPAWTLSACGVGTLQCETSNVPSICDFSQNYVLNGDKCEVQTVAGCEIASFDSSNAPCFLCESGKVLDENSEVCVAVDSENIVENCFRYDKSSSDCIECATDYYISGGECKTVGNIKVSNCQMYSSITQCKVCDPGYYLVGNECVEIEAVANCRVHSNRKCSECSAGYYMNLGYNSHPMAPNVSTFELFASGKFSEITINLTENETTVCQKIEVKHCSELASAKECAVCEEGYFLTGSKLCERFPEAGISHCVKYSSATRCEKCEDTHYVKRPDVGAETCELIGVVENCKTYDLSSGFCSECEDGYWRNDELNSCVARQYNPPVGCKTINPNADECQECNDNATMITDKTGCFNNISNCLTQITATNLDAGSHFCSKCETTHFLENQGCSVRTITGCKTYLDDRNACDVCDDDRYISDDFLTCTVKSIDGCVEYTTDDKNECTKCENLKYLSTAKVCSDITNKTDCFFSNGTTDECIQCNAGILRTSAGVCTGARTNAHYDSNCAGNTSETDDSSCASCTNSAHLFSDSNLKPAQTEAQMNTWNCLKVSSDGTGCQQCKNGHYLTGTTCTLDTDPASLCLRTTAASTQNLDGSADCEECKDVLGMKLTTGVCSMSTDAYSYIDCQSTSFTTGECSLCEAGAYPVDPSKTMCAKDSSNPTQFSTISGCAVMETLTTCAICDIDKVVSSDGSACETTKAGFSISQNNFDVEMNQIGSLWAANVANCLQYTQVSETEVVCTKCDNTTIGIIDETKYSYRLNDLATGSEIYNPYSECVDKTLPFKDSTGNAHVDPDTCEFGFKLSSNSNDGYSCLRCKAGLIGSYITTSQYNDGTALSNNEMSMSNCVAVTASEPKSQYIGVSSARDIDPVKMTDSNFFAFTNCTNTAEVVFYNVAYSLSTGINSTPSANGATPNKVAFCGTEAAVIADMTQKVDNCAIYAHKDTAQLTNYDPSTTKILNVVCQSCKPGFYIAQKDADGITQCAEIHGCNTSTNNIWLNGCSNPDSGGWKVKSSKLWALYYDPMPTSSQYFIENCLLLDQPNEKCLVCKPGFSSAGSSCVAVTSANSNCADNQSGMGQTLLKKPSSYTNAEIMYTMANLAHIRVNYPGASDHATNTNSLCKQCDSGYLLLKKADETYYKYCGKRADETLKVENGDTYFMFNMIECATGYAKEDGVCKPFTSDANCIELDGGSCDDCKTGFKLVDGICTQTNCDEYTGPNCLRCAPNHVEVKRSNVSICEPNSSDPCEVYSPLLSTCLKCRDSTKKPFRIEFTNGTVPQVQTFCGDFTIPANGWENIDPGFYVDIRTNGTAIQNTEIKYIDTSEVLNRQYDSQSIGDPADALCLPTRSVSNSQNMISSLVVTSCESGYTLIKDNSCMDKTQIIPNCTSVDMSDVTCDQCNDTHYISSDQKSCVPRVNSLHCDNVNNSSDTCSNCVAKVKVMNDQGYCVDYTAENCRLLHNSQDKCAFCVDNAWMDQSDSDRCKLSEDPNCVKMKEFENECQLCANGFYLKTQGLVQTCEPVTKPNCETTNPYKDECVTCKNMFYSETVDGVTKCLPNTEMDFCVTYSRDSDDCLTCEEGYYSATGKQECRKYPTGIEFCSGYSDATTCTQCDGGSGKYLKDNACVEVSETINGCIVYNSERTCSKCSTGKFLTNETRCDSYDSQVADMCLEFESFEKCKSCKENDILNEETKLCEPSGIENCKVATRGSPNLCQECKSGFFTSSNRQSCQQPSTLIDHCLDYETQTDCKKCEPGYLLSLNNSSCTAIEDKAGENCSTALEVDKLLCDVCEFGYVKNEIGECEKISESNCALMIGDKCGLCFLKMHMNSEGKCENPNVVPPTISVEIVQVFTIFMILLTLIK